MVKHIFQNRQVWGMTLVAGGVIALITFFLLGALLSPTENTHNLPVALVNGDQGATAGPQQMNFGKQVADRLTGPQQTDALKWTVLNDRQAALDGVRQRKYYAALVIPPDFSASLVGITTQAGQKPAQIEYINNPVGPTLGLQIVQGALQNIVSGISKGFGEQLTQQVQTNHVPLALPAASFLSNPVQLSSVPVATIGDHSGRGISVFFLSILITLAGILAAMLPDTVIQRIAHDRRKNDQPVSGWAIFTARLVLYAVAGLAAVGGLLVTAWLLIMDVPDWWSLFLFATLYVWTVSALVLFCQVALGRTGLGVASLVLVLLSLPASGGLFPAESIPAFWQWLNAVVPMRFMVDGIRSVLFLDREWDNGFGTAIVVLTAYGLGALALTSLIVWLQELRQPKKAEQPKTAGPVAA